MEQISLIDEAAKRLEETNADVCIVQRYKNTDSKLFITLNSNYEREYPVKNLQDAIDCIDTVYPALSCELRRIAGDTANEIPFDAVFNKMCQDNESEKQHGKNLKQKDGPEK